MWKSSLSETTWLNIKLPTWAQGAQSKLNSYQPLIPKRGCPQVNQHLKGLRARRPCRPICRRRLTPVAWQHRLFCGSTHVRRQSQVVYTQPFTRLEKFAKLGYKQPLSMLFCLTRIFFPLPLPNFAWLISGLIFSCLLKFLLAVYSRHP